MKVFLSRIAYVIIVFGIIFTYIGISDCYYNSKTPVDYATVKESDIQKGMIIEGDLYANYGAFQESYTTTNGVKTGNSKYSYMIPIGEKQYMGLENNTQSMEDELEKQADMTYNYLQNNSASEPNVIHFKGRVKKLDSESTGYLRDYMVDIGFSESEVTQYLLAYYIECEDYDGWLTELAIGVICLLIGGAILLIPVLIARKQNAANVGIPSGGTVVHDTFDDDTNIFQTDSTTNTTSALQLKSDSAEKEVHTDTFGQENIDVPDTTDTDSFGSGLGEGMLDDYQSADGLNQQLKND